MRLAFRKRKKILTRTVSTTVMFRERISDGIYSFNLMYEDFNFNISILIGFGIYNINKDQFVISISGNIERHSQDEVDVLYAQMKEIATTIEEKIFS